MFSQSFNNHRCDGFVHAKVCPRPAEKSVLHDTSTLQHHSICIPYVSQELHIAIIMLKIQKTCLLAYCSENFRIISRDFEVSSPDARTTTPHRLLLTMLELEYFAAWDIPFVAEDLPIAFDPITPCCIAIIVSILSSQLLSQKAAKNRIDTDPIQYR